MIHVKFKNLKKSEFARNAVIERMQPLVHKFPALMGKKIVATLEMENSPFQAGPDVFKVQVYISDGKFKGVIVKKTSSNLYKALAEVVDHLLERLNRVGDKDRVKERMRARQLADLFTQKKQHRAAERTRKKAEKMYRFDWPQKLSLIA